VELWFELSLWSWPWPSRSPRLPPPSKRGRLALVILLVGLLLLLVGLLRPSPGSWCR
jgi:hypothetical protein